MFYNCPEIVAAVDSPLVGNRFAEEPVAGIAEAGEGCYSMLEEEEEDDILVRLVMRLIDGRKKRTPYWEGEEVPVAPTEGEGVCSRSRLAGGVHRLDIGSRTC